MNSQVVHTLIEPAIVGILPVEPSIVSIVPVRTETYTLASRIATTLTSLATTTIATTMATTTALANSSTSVPTSSMIPPLPSSFDPPAADREDWDPTLAILSLIAVIICGIILLVLISYLIYLRFRGKCPNCPVYEDELKKWKRGELKPIVPFVVHQRMRELDLEKGGMDLQVKMFRDQNRMQTLASLESRTEVASEHTNGSGEGTVMEYDQVDNSITVPSPLKPQRPPPAHLPARHDSGSYADAARPVDEDPEATLVNDTGHPATHSVYLRDVVAPRETKRKRLLREAGEQAEKQAFTKICNIIQDPTLRESALLRANDNYDKIVTARARAEQRADEEERSSSSEVSVSSARPRKTRFKERFSLATIINPEV